MYLMNLEENQGFLVWFLALNILKCYTSAASAVSGVLIYDQSDCDNKGYTNTADYITSFGNTNLSLCIGSLLIP